MNDPLTVYDKKTLAAYVEHIENALAAAKGEIERLSLDVKILTEELERERRPKMDER